MSLGTTTEIKETPIVILYKDGIPTYQYLGDITMNGLIEFIIQGGINKAPATPVAQPVKPRGPNLTTTGIPICGSSSDFGGLCYKPMDQAYSKS